MYHKTMPMHRHLLLLPFPSSPALTVIKQKQDLLDGPWHVHNPFFQTSLLLPPEICVRPLGWVLGLLAPCRSPSGPHLWLSILHRQNWALFIPTREGAHLSGRAADTQFNQLSPRYSCIFLLFRSNIKIPAQEPRSPINHAVNTTR